MRIIPAIDIIEGKCVRLSKGDYNTKIIYNENPLEVAKSFEAHGIEYLQLVDLDGAKSSKIVNYKILEQIASQTKLKIDFGGGLKADSDLKIAFESGANQITGGSIAVKNRTIFEKWIAEYGSDKIILGADSNNEKVAVSGWLEDSNEDLVPFIQDYQRKGIQYVICTDIAEDGMFEGPSFRFVCEDFGRSQRNKINRLRRNYNLKRSARKLAKSGRRNDHRESDLRRKNFVETIGTIIMM